MSCWRIVVCNYVIVRNSDQMGASLRERMGPCPRKRAGILSCLQVHGTGRRYPWPSEEDCILLPIIKEAVSSWRQYSPMIKERRDGILLGKGRGCILLPKWESSGKTLVVGSFWVRPNKSAMSLYFCVSAWVESSQILFIVFECMWGWNGIHLPLGRMCVKRGKQAVMRYKLKISY